MTTPINAPKCSTNLWCDCPDCSTYWALMDYDNAQRDAGPDYDDEADHDEAQALDYER